MFVKKLVEKASKKPSSSLNGLTSDDVCPRLVFHYGIPAGANSLSYDSSQNILAISTKDGRIKLLGRDNTQAFLESTEAVPSKFLQFLENQGILLNVTINNHIEVWDVDKKELPHVHIFKEEITSFTVLQRSSYIYVGDSLGNISVFRLDQESCHLIKMQYCIPVSASHGSTTEPSEDATIMYTLPHPMSESRRVLIIFRDGLIILWGIQESKVLFIIGGNVLTSLSHDPNKKVTSACWACPIGSKVVVGYSNGEIFLWGVPAISHPEVISNMNKGPGAAQNFPLCKFNLGYKKDKVAVVSLRWAPIDGRESCLYINGVSQSGSPYSFQIILLKESNESRTIKLELPLPDACVDMEILSIASEKNKHKQVSLAVLLKSGCLHVYDDSAIVKYLLESQSKPTLSLPKGLVVKLPFGDSSITVAKYFSSKSELPNSFDKDHMMRINNLPSLVPLDTKSKDGDHRSCKRFSGFSKINNLYITGHSNGAINFWDASCPFLQLILSVKQQSEQDHTLSGVPVTALRFDITSRVLVSGDKSGMVRIFNFKPDESISGNNLFSFPAHTMPGCSHAILNIKLIKLKGAVLSICMNHCSRHLAIGCDKGYVSIIDMEGPTVLSEKHLPSELSSGIISLQFGIYSSHNSEKTFLFVANEYSSLMALDGDTGDMLSTSIVRPKKPYRALFMQILDGLEISVGGTFMLDSSGQSKGNIIKDIVPKQSLLLLCSEKAVYLYSVMHLVQGIKKVHCKKKVSGTIRWASTFYSSNSHIGLILLFSSGKIEIRSLPDLSLLKEASFRGWSFLSSEPSLNSTSSLCCSSDGELVMVNKDQEIFFISVLFQNHVNRLLDYISKVYEKDVGPCHKPAYVPIIQKEKKKGIFATVIKDIKGNKTKHIQDNDDVNSGRTIGEDLSVIFSTINFPLVAENNDVTPDNDSDDLNIDDIDLEDTRENFKGQDHPTSNKQKLKSRMQALKGKLKQKKEKNGHSSVKETGEDEKSLGTVDLIKKRYGYHVAADSRFPTIAETKLNENIRKLQGIDTRATEMQNTAQSFSAMANQLLQTAKEKKKP